MAHEECKIYFDGSHFIAIPKTTRPNLKRPRPPEELIAVEGEEAAVTGEEETGAEQKAAEPRRVTRKEYFEELHDESLGMKMKERKEVIARKMRPYFRDGEEAALFVEAQFQRKARNAASRWVRMSRKVNLANFNYFCTFTYDDKLHTEDTFKRKLRTCFRNLVNRRGWKYAGVWELSPKKQRLHFHGLFYIPEDGMVGKLEVHRDYNTTKRQMQETVQNTYFNKRFGRSDFEALGSQTDVRHALSYITKYMEKTGEKMVYSKGLPQYFISDILDDDVASLYGIDDRKLLLFDDFSCFDEGVYMGEVSPEVIAQMRKSN
jgi:hypothetical protein